MLRMNTPSSDACACIRSRSPRTAPPLNGLVGSTAITPTDGGMARPAKPAKAPSPCGLFALWGFCVRSVGTSRSTSVLLPAPGGPVTPTRYARPVRAKMARTRSTLAGSSSSISEMARAIARGSPDRTRSARVPVTRRGQFLRWMSWTRSSRQELAGDDEPLNLARALADGGQLDVAEILLGRIVLHEAVAAMDLHAVVG